MKGFYSVSTSSKAVASDAPYRSASAPPRPPVTPPAGDRPASFVRASHEALFERDDAARCDACHEPLPAEDDAAGYGLQGRGVYVWRRGGEPQFESAPLCPSCAAAIGMTALARWEIEEEEG